LITQFTQKNYRIRIVRDEILYISKLDDLIIYAL